MLWPDDTQFKLLPIIPENMGQLCRSLSAHAQKLLNFSLSYHNRVAELQINFLILKAVMMLYCEFSLIPIFMMKQECIVTSVYII